MYRRSDRELRSLGTSAKSWVFFIYREDEGSDSKQLLPDILSMPEVQATGARVTNSSSLASIDLLLATNACREQIEPKPGPKQKPESWLDEPISGRDADRRLLEIYYYARCLSHNDSCIILVSRYYWIRSGPATPGLGPLSMDHRHARGVKWRLNGA